MTFNSVGGLLPTRRGRTWTVSRGQRWRAKSSSANSNSSLYNKCSIFCPRRVQNHKLYRYRSIIFHKSPFHLSSTPALGCSDARPHIRRNRKRTNKKWKKETFPSVSIYFLIIDISPPSRFCFFSPLYS